MCAATEARKALSHPHSCCSRYAAQKPQPRRQHQREPHAGGAGAALRDARVAWRLGYSQAGAKFSPMHGQYGVCLSVPSAGIEWGSGIDRCEIAAGQRANGTMSPRHPDKPETVVLPHRDTFFFCSLFFASFVLIFFSFAFRLGPLFLGPVPGHDLTPFNARLMTTV